MMARRGQRKMIARQRNEHGSPHIEDLVEFDRAASPAVFALHRNAVPIALHRIAIERVLPDPSRRQMNVDVRSRAEWRQIPIVRICKFERTYIFAEIIDASDDGRDAVD